jgi:AcrR family transcriptional regulator
MADRLSAIMVSGSTSFPARRAAAAANRGKILAAARAAFAAGETEVSMAEIARRSGVGMATLYRNFPGRRELLETLYVDEVNAVCEAAGTVEGKTPGARLEAWLYRCFAFYNSKRHVASELLRQTDDPGTFFSANRSRGLAAGQPLLLAAQQSREVRDDLTLEQILQMIVAIAAIQGGPDHVEPILQTALEGLFRSPPPRRGVP